MFQDTDTKSIRITCLAATRLEPPTEVAVLVEPFRVGHVILFISLLVGRLIRQSGGGKGRVTTHYYFYKGSMMERGPERAPWVQVRRLKNTVLYSSELVGCVLSLF